jgi:hypothetical protein
MFRIDLPGGLGFRIQTAQINRDPQAVNLGFVFAFGIGADSSGFGDADPGFRAVGIPRYSFAVITKFFPAVYRNRDSMALAPDLIDAFKTEVPEAAAAKSGPGNSPDLQFLPGFRIGDKEEKKRQQSRKAAPYDKHYQMKAQFAAIPLKL